MKTRTLARSLAPLTCTVALSACAVDAVTPIDDTNAEGLVVPGLTPTLTTPGVLPSLGLRGRFTPITASGEAGEVGEFSNGLDLAVGPAVIPSWNPATVSRTAPDAWATAAAGDPYSSTPAFATDLSDAEAGIATHLRNIDIGAVDQIADFVETLQSYTTALDNVRIDRPDPTSTLVTYTPERARWVSARMVSTPIRTRFPGAVSVPVWTGYQAPTIDELRQRGARTYCAAREAQRHQTDGSMGSQAAFTMRVFGHDIDFLVVEPSAVLSGPERHEGVRLLGGGTLPDGAQAFSVPMLMGTRITPIRGLGLPGLAEMRYPVAYLTGDSERATLGDQRTTRIGNVSFNTYNRAWQTVSHADAFAATSQRLTIEARQIPVFTMGAVSVFFGITFEFTVGGVAVGEGRSDVPTGRLEGFPGAPRVGWNAVYGDRTFADGAWIPSPSCLREFCTRYPWDWAVLPDGNPYGANSWVYQLTAVQAGAFDTRIWQDNDKALDGNTGLRVRGGLQASVGFPRLGPFEASVDGSAALEGRVDLHHVVREALTAERADGARAVPTAALTVRPRTTALATIAEGDIVLHLSLDLGYFTARWDPTLISIDPITLASYDSDDTHAWPESSVMRVSTGAASGADTMLRPDARSHMPGGANFAAMPQDVPTCLADRRPNPTTPPPRSHCAPEGGTVTGNLCVYTRAQLPADRICADPAAAATAVGANAAQRECLQAYYSMLCSPVSAREGTMISHVLDTRSESAMQNFADVTRACVAAFAPRTGDGAADAAEGQRVVERMFPLSPCDAAGHLVSPTNVVTGSGDPTRPPPVSTDGC